jgi:hypothetical protein
LILATRTVRIRRLTLSLSLSFIFCFQVVNLLKAEAQTTLTPLVIENNGISQPESMAYDPVDDVYLVSNINATGPNSKGFISRISPDGKLLALKWIDGANPATPLQAPSGIFVRGDTLYVVDIVSVKLFERANGKFKGELKIPGATSLNDEAVAPDGTVYVADLGLSFGPSGLQVNKETRQKWGRFFRTFVYPTLVHYLLSR